MNSMDIIKTIRCHPTTFQRFRGVYANDNLPKTVSLPCAVVINKDNSSGPGTHWVAVYISKHRQGVYMDSLGHPPSVRVKKFLNTNCDYWCYNSQRIQHRTSILCGLFVCAFLFMMNTGHTLHQFLDLFSENLVRNDYVVKSVVRKMCNKKNKTEHNIFS